MSEIYSGWDGDRQEGGEELTRQRTAGGRHLSNEHTPWGAREMVAGWDGRGAARKQDGATE